MERHLDPTIVQLSVGNVGTAQGKRKRPPPMLKDLRPQDLGLTDKAGSWVWSQILLQMFSAGKSSQGCKLTPSTPNSSIQLSCEIHSQLQTQPLGLFLESA